MNNGPDEVPKNFLTFEFSEACQRAIQKLRASLAKYFPGDPIILYKIIFMDKEII
jgi:hypothetical protein